MGSIPVIRKSAMRKKWSSHPCQKRYCKVLPRCIPYNASCKYVFHWALKAFLHCAWLREDVLHQYAHRSKKHLASTHRFVFAYTRPHRGFTALSLDCIRVYTRVQVQERKEHFQCIGLIHTNICIDTTHLVDIWVRSPQQKIHAFFCATHPYDAEVSAP